MRGAEVTGTVADTRGQPVTDYAATLESVLRSARIDVAMLAISDGVTLARKR